MDGRMEIYELACFIPSRFSVPETNPRFHAAAKIPCGINCAIRSNRTAIRTLGASSRRDTRVSREFALTSVFPWIACSPRRRKIFTSVRRGERMAALGDIGIVTRLRTILDVVQLPTAWSKIYVHLQWRTPSKRTGCPLWTRMVPLYAWRERRGAVACTPRVSTVADQCGHVMRARHGTMCIFNIQDFCFQLWIHL